jgi:hypothetical protein
MEYRPTIPDSETDVANRLANGAKPTPDSAFSAALIYPVIMMNLALIFGGAWLAIGPSLGYLPKPYGWIASTQVGSAWIGVAMVWCFPGCYSIFHGLGGRGVEAQYRAGERRICLFGFYFPTAFTFLLYYPYVWLLQRTPAILLACVVGALLLVAGGFPDSDLWNKGAERVVMAILISLAYGYATVLQLNCVLDRSSPTVYRSVVSSKHYFKKGEDFLKRGSYLGIGPWGPELEGRSMKVPSEVFKTVQPGDAVCVVLKNGALGVRWYTIQSCPWNGGPIYPEQGGSL